MIARKIAPDKAQLMGERIGVIRKQLLMMENQLKEASAVASLLH